MDSTHGEPYEYQPELDAYLRALGRVLPDAVEGVYLTGSTALGDYRHGQSDLDLLTLTTRPLTEPELAALDASHKELEQGRQPHLDAVYIPREFVGKLPQQDAPGHAYVVDGEFKRGTDSQDLVIWAILAQCGITLRGPAAKSLGAAPDRAEFAAWNLGNLAPVRCSRSSFVLSRMTRDIGGVPSEAVFVIPIADQRIRRRTKVALGSTAEGCGQQHPE